MKRCLIFITLLIVIMSAGIISSCESTRANNRLDQIFDEHEKRVQEKEQEREKKPISDDRFNGTFKYKAGEYVDTSVWWFNGTIKARHYYESWITGSTHDGVSPIYEIHLEEGKLWYRLWNTLEMYEYAPILGRWTSAGKYHFDNDGNLNLVVEYNGSVINRKYTKTVRYQPETRDNF